MIGIRLSTRLNLNDSHVHRQTIKKLVEQIILHKDASVEHFTLYHPTLLLLKALLQYIIVHVQFILRLTTYLLNGEKHGCGNILV